MGRYIVEVRTGHKHGPVTGFINQQNIETLNPFILWDHFEVSGVQGTAGFGFHGHSGIATITYPVIGDIAHEDTDGHTGVLKAGGIQLMASGAGVLHKETVYPMQGQADAFQLWTLLDQNTTEMGPVTYSLAQKDDAPVVVTPQSETKVLIGQHEETISSAKHSVAITYLEIAIQPNEQWKHVVAKDQTSGFIYVRAGEVKLAEKSLHAKKLGVLNKSDAQIDLTAGKSGATIMVALGQPLNQPIISSGPSAHSTMERLATGTRNIQRLSQTLIA